jgi:Domain of unknown function(DUF2779)
VGGFSGGRSYTQELLGVDKYLMRQIEEVDIAPAPNNRVFFGLSPLQRRMEQINRVKKNDKTSYFDKEGFQSEMKSWKFPLHMIDFETSMVAIPFHKGFHPYEGIAFQFSHHIIDPQWNIRHETQYLSFA